MNGIHDLGGMQGMGPIEREADEPVFHQEWEGRVFAITRAVGAWRKWNIDAGRHGIERLPAADYLRMSYYEKWLARNLALLVEHGLVSRAEIETGRPHAGSAKSTPPLTAAMAVESARRRGSYVRPDANVQPRFETGQSVRARNLHPPGHTRLPRYVRGRLGSIERYRGIFVFPDTNAHFQGEQPQPLYSVRFAARELWGEAAPPRDAVYLDLWESYLEQA